jgi:hypothetical protein
MLVRGNKREKLVVVNHRNSKTWLNDPQ